MNCPVCLHSVTAPALTGTDCLFETTSRTFHLSGCAACHSLFIDPLPQQDEIPSFYPNQYWRNSSSGFLTVLENGYRRIALHDHIAFIRAAARHMNTPVRAPVRILDVGCGTATLLGLLKPHGFEVLGLDFSKEAAAVAKARNGVQVIVGSIHDGHFQDASFDVVTLFHVMEHVTNPREVLAEVRRILRPGGRLVVQVPNIESWQFRLFGPRWYGLDIPRHVIDYSSNSMQTLLQNCGFTIGRVRHFNLRDNAPALASSLFPSLDPVSRTVRQRQRNVRESLPAAWLRHLLYLGLVVSAYPFVLAEAAAGSGATVMVEALPA